MVDQTVCVIGCSGFVGSHVAAELLSRGYSVNGTLRDSGDQNTGWIREQLAPLAGPGQNLRLFSAHLQDKSSLAHAMQGCSGVIMCAGVEKQEPATLEVMVSGAENVLDAALELGIGAAVFTSSTGSTNPPGGDPALKNEIDHWSDPDQQLAAGKYSPAAKTRMDQTALARMQASNGKLRVCVINPSMITGPAYQPEPVASLRSFQSILQGKRFSDRIPNGSMSMIDVRDLANLHVNALESEQARGRFFGVKQSWHWRDILAALARTYPAYEMPEFPLDESPVRPTQFDLSRQHTLGCELRDLDDMLADVIQELQRRDML
jgi:nucleoside-diphosphate-sugar epimerase